MTKYALYEYQTENIGDEIQSIAARRFLPQVDYLVDRDQVGQFRAPGSAEEVRLIANAWYMHEPYAWPPRDPNLSALLVSMFVDVRDPAVERAFFSRESIDYLRAYGPVGARDLTTAALFEKHQVPAYWSGCLTLTLLADARYPRREFVLAVDVSEEVYQHLVAVTDRPVIRTSPYFKAALSPGERLAFAEFTLYLYQSAHATVTSRLHCMLPSLAFETPVLFLQTPGKYQAARFAGLENLVRRASEADFQAGQAGFDLESPPPNPPEYLALRATLTARAKEFTGFDAADIGESFTRSANVDLANDELVQAICAFTEPSWRAHADRIWHEGAIVHYRRVIDEANLRIAALEERLRAVAGAVEPPAAAVPQVKSPLRIWRRER